MNDSRKLEPLHLVPSAGAPAIDADPDHHLWRNGRLWWIAFTIHLPARWQKERIRRSLGTTDLVEARRRRDALLASFAGHPEVTLSLRPSRRARGTTASRAAVLSGRGA